jgi:TetR/AcrR family fatty acid metabolism transcriptional regulator
MRKDQIIEATLNLIANEGYRSLKLKKIANWAGIAHSSLFYHFKSKDELLNVALQNIGQLLINNVEEAKNKHEEATKCLQFLIKQHVEMFRGNLSRFLVFFFDSLYFGNPSQKVTVKILITKYLNKIEEIIRQGQKNHSIRSDACPKTLSLMIFGMILPATPLSNTAKDKYNSANNVELFFRKSFHTYHRCKNVKLNQISGLEMKGNEHG